MNVWHFIINNRRELLFLIEQHLMLVFVSTSIAVLIGVPAGILLSRRPGLRTPVLGIANVMQTVPSLALFGLLIPLPFVGGIGARAAIVALVLYALLPVIRNTVTGILGVDPAVREAAVAMGMTDRQVLWQVELPLSLSVILTGIRVAVVISFGVATIAAAVGAGGLGVYIFRGLRQNDNLLLLAGAIPAALMALGADFLLGLFEKQFDVGRKRAEPRSWIVRWRWAFVGLVLGILAVTGLLSYRSAQIANAGNTAGKVVVGSKDFTESVLLGEIVAQMLEERGVQVERQFELGGNLTQDALVSGRIDLYPEYTGTAYTAILHHKPITDTAAVYDQVRGEYEQLFKVEASAPLGFSNDFAILVRGAEARRLNLKTISDAVPHAHGWRAGFGQDFMSRQDGYPGFSRAYGLRFAQPPREMDLSLTYRALAEGQVDLIAGNSTDGLIAALDLYQLQDDKHYFPPYQAILLTRKDTLQRVPALSEVLAKLANSISTDEMRRLNYEIDGKKRDRREVVREWLQKKG
jgi:osmoprotectant transport system permease protein